MKTIVRELLISVIIDGFMSSCEIAIAEADDSIPDCTNESVNYFQDINNKTAPFKYV